MDWQSAFNIAAGLLGGIGGWMLRVIWDAQQRLKIDLDSLERRLPDVYARRDDIKNMMDAINDRFDRIERLMVAQKP